MHAVSPVSRIGIGLSVLIFGLAALSYGFPYGVNPADSPLLLYVGLTLVTGGLWAFLPYQIRQSTGAASPLLTIILIGFAMRGSMMLSTPVLEDDSYRYLWDGAVTAHGIDPYKYAPAEAAPHPLFGTQDVTIQDQDLAQLQTLAERHAEPHSRINYPFVSTIYPPFAQAAFALAHALDPFGLTGWRLVLLAADLVTLSLLLKLLKSYHRSAAWAALYWWNPVVILQGFGAGHMDVLVLPFLVGALLLAKSQRVWLATLALAGGAAIKLWPILLFPILARPLLRQPMKLLLVSLAFGFSLALLLLPQLLHALKPDAGLNAYASDWRTHAFLFAILEDVVFAVFEAPGQIARLTVAGLMIALTGSLALRFADQVDHLPILATAIIAALIFLSPTGYPWYFIWLAPFVCFVPHPGLLSLFALAPFYWLRFLLGDQSLLYQWGLVPIAFGIPLGLLVWSYMTRRRADAVRHHHPRFE
ncbi:MAG: hypothetical protein AAF996_02495 [Pseudomonadota bacterium]